MDERRSDLVERVLEALRAEAGDQAVTAVLARVARRLMTEGVRADDDDEEPAADDDHRLM